MEENLSQKLFKPRLKVKETSTVSNSKASEHLAETGQSWYRILRREFWAWLGLPAIETEQLFAEIAVQDKPRTSQLLDTVIGYQPGTWSYEWSQRSVGFHQKAQAFEQEGDKAKAKQHYLLASYAATIAAYPHFRGDDLARPAESLAYNNFSSAMNNSPYFCKSISVPVGNKRVPCYLHLPDTESIKPVVLVSGSLDSIQTVYYPLFERYFAKAGFAMMTIDLPGVGHCSHWDLQQDSSKIHGAILDYLSQIPWIDHTRVAMLGYRFGGNVAARMAFLAPKQLKAVVTLGAPVDRLFSDIHRFSALPRMYLDCLANRCGVDAANTEALYYRCMPLSLKTQGIMGVSKTAVPMFVSGHKEDPICPAEDMALLARASRDAKVHHFSGGTNLEDYSQTLEQVTQWLQNRL